MATNLDIYTGNKDFEFLGFSFNGRHSSEFNLTVVSSGLTQRALFAEFEDKTVEVSGRDGAYYFGTKIKTRPLNVSVAFDNLTSSKKRELLLWLKPQLVAKLFFDEAPYKYYWAKLASPPSFSFVPFETDITGGVEHLFKGTLELTFVANDPYGYSDYSSVPEVLIWKQPVNGAGSFATYGTLSTSAATEKTTSYTNVVIATNRITISSHGFGAANSFANIKLSSLTGTVPAGLVLGQIYLVRIVDTNTIEFLVDITSQGTGTHGFTLQTLTYPGWSAESGLLNQSDSSTSTILYANKTGGHTISSVSGVDFYNGGTMPVAAKLTIDINVWETNTANLIINNPLNSTKFEIASLKNLTALSTDGGPWRITCDPATGMVIGRTNTDSYVATYNLGALHTGDFLIIEPGSNQTIATNKAINTLKVEYKYKYW